MPRPLFAKIDVAALAHNMGVASRAAPMAQILPVLKANAYGHGLLRVANGLGAADGFAVLTVNEGALLRETGFTLPIVLLEGFFDQSELREIVDLNLRPVIHSLEQVEMLCHEQILKKQKIDVFLKVETGMHRLGFSPKHSEKVVERLHVEQCVSSVTLMTHFSSADTSKESVFEQLARFMPLVRKTKLRTSMANSAALLNYPETHGDWVRPGIMLYGCSPFPKTTGAQFGLRPVMSFESQIIAIQNVKMGECVGYGCAFKASKSMKVGIVACGYADGYPRHAQTGTPVIVDNKLTQLIGRVSMDMLNVDLTSIPDAHVGSKVVLWGGQLPIEVVAESAGTICYELLTGTSANRIQIIHV